MRKTMKWIAVSPQDVKYPLVNGSTIVVSTIPESVSDSKEEAASYLEGTDGKVVRTLYVR